MLVIDNVLEIASIFVLTRPSNSMNEARHRGKKHRP